MTGSSYFPAHCHSEYSVLDGMGTVNQMVERVALLGQPALALTDHGTMAGCLRLYKACARHGIAPFPGIEAYVVSDVNDPDGKNQRFHLGLLALDYEGYKALLAASSLSYGPDRFYRRPLLDMGDLTALGKQYGQHLAVTTGCYFGLVVQALLDPSKKNGGLRMVRWLKSTFPNVFVEVQDHGVVHGDGLDDHFIASALLDIAEVESLPVILGVDSHYCEAWQQPVHDLMKAICYFGESEDDAFPGGPYHLGSTKAVRKPWTADEWDRIEEGHGHLLDLNQVTMPALDSYRFHVPAMSGSPDRVLKRKATKALDDSDYAGYSPYEARVKHELSVIEAMGFANYFLMADDIASWCKRQGIFIDARGSANGSLICFLLGITTVDSIEWNCDFSRFLSLDRKKPPDIDFDVEHERRDDVLAYIASQHPSMVQIGTYGRIGITEDEDGEDKGSVYVQYAAAMRSKAGAYNGIAPEDRPLLEALAELDVRKSAGRHAGGFVIPGEGLAIEDYIPTMTVGSKGSKVRHTATQPTMDDIEDCGYVKLDILGLKQLSTMRRCMEAIGKDPVHDGMTWIPNDDRKAAQVLRSGIPGNGVFQFEGFSTAKGAKQMKVQNTQEAILCIALFRPAMMESGMTDRFLAARAAKVVQTLHPIVDSVLADTWGVPVFQDQVIEMMRRVGLGFDDLNDLLKAVKASNDKIAEYAQETFDRIYPVFITKAVKQGCSVQEAEDIWQTVVDFSDYGFNRSHATNYGIRGYRMAYLKAHYPTEFMAATLATWAGTPKEAKYIQEARRQKMVVARASVNDSDVLWTSDGPLRLRKGLLSVKGIGVTVAEQIVAERMAVGRPYTDVDDFCARLPAGKVSGTNDLPKGTLKGACAALAQAGALKCIGWDPGD